MLTFNKCTSFILMRVARTTVWRRPGRMRRKTRRSIDRWCCSTAGKVIRRSYEYTVYIGVYYSWLHSGILAWTLANIHLLIVNYFIIAIRRSADFLHGDFIIIGRQILHRWLPPMIRRSPFQMQCVRKEICCCIFLRLLQLYCSPPPQWNIPQCTCTIRRLL